MQKWYKPALSNTSLSSIQKLYILIRVNPNGFNPFWLPELHTSAVLPGEAVTRGFRIWAARQKSHSSACMCLFISVCCCHLCPLTASKKFPIISPQHLFFSNTGRWSYATFYPSVFSSYTSLLVGTTSPSCLGNFQCFSVQCLTFSACHLVSSLPSHKRKWLLGGAELHLIFPEFIMAWWM